MTCSYCGTRNGDGEHRCTRCGRKPEDTLIGGFAMPVVNGALADATAAGAAHARRGRRAARPAAARGAGLLAGGAGLVVPGTSNVIAMPPRVETKPRIRPDVPAKPALAEARGQTRQARPGRSGHSGFPAARAGQTAPVGHHRGSGDLLRSARGHHAPPRRGLRARLEHGDARVRALPARVSPLLGGQFELTRTNLTIFGAMFLMIGFTYGLLFAWAGTETPGMRWAQLRLTTFDGFPPDRQPAPGALRRLLPEPLHAARPAVVAGR